MPRAWRWQTTREARGVIRAAPTMGSAVCADALESAGVDPGAWVLVDVGAWLWLRDWAEDPKSVTE